MLQESYTTKVVPKLKERLSISNTMAVPRITKVVLNVGVGKFTKDSNYIAMVENNLTKISGQKPVSISNFKLREGMIVGLMVTLRGKRMYDFLEKLLRVTFPRVRDFRGIARTGFDRQGNFSFGFKEQIAFPELSGEEIEKTHGLEITILTNTKNEEHARALLEEFGFPFAKQNNK